MRDSTLTIRGRWRTALAVFAVVMAATMSASSQVKAQTTGSPSGEALAQQFNLSPSSRVVLPTAVYQTSGEVDNASGLLSGGVATISGQNSQLVLDFGKDVGGIISVSFSAASDANQTLGIAFSESNLFIGPDSDASTSRSTADGYISAPVTPGQTFTAPAKYLRGAFRYLTLFLVTSGWASIDGVSLAFTPAPEMTPPNSYPNYFFSNDTLLNRIWYAGAYTLQLDTIGSCQARAGSAPSSGWDNSACIGYGTEFLSDGAKRDRTDWPGDFSISFPGEFASIGQLDAMKTSLVALYADQDAAGALPYAGPPLNFCACPSNGGVVPGEISDDYHLDALIETADYYLYSGDIVWLNSNWISYERALAYAVAKTDPATGLFRLTGPADWAPLETPGIDIYPNALMYEVLNTCVPLATAEADTTLATVCSTEAVQLKSSVNTLLYDSSVGAYKDNPETGISGAALYPQDGNAAAVWFGLTQSATQTASVLSYLKTNWTALGAHTPEWSGIHPFPGGMEVMARFTADDDEDALQLIRTEWGYMLNAPIGTGSTFWEGYFDTGQFAGYYGTTYPSSYTSLAHGWSTAPTAALTYFVLGVSPDSGGGATYQVIPHPGDLTHVEGRLAMADTGPVDASWDRSQTDFTLTLTVPDSSIGSSGEVGIPRVVPDQVVCVNGVEAWNGSTFLGSPGIASADEDANYIYFQGVQPGTRTFDESCSGLAAVTPEAPLTPLLAGAAGIGLAVASLLRRRRAGQDPFIEDQHAQRPIA